MKRCPVCKTKLNGNFSNCPVCGTKLNPRSLKDLYGPKGEIKPFSDEENEILNGYYAKKHHRTKKGLLIAAACLCGAALVSGATYGITRAIIGSSESIEKEYNVKFVGADGSEILQTEKLKKGEEIIYKGSIPKKDAADNKNYVFTGWDPELKTGDKVTGDVTYTAQFKQIDISKYLTSTRTGNTCSVSWNKDFGEELKYLSIPSRMEVDGIMCTVTKIESPKTNNSDGATGAFENCETLLGVEIPDTITEIEDGAFRGCTNLKKVVLSNGIETIPESCFEYCESLTDVTISSSVTTIKNRAFAYCYALSNLVLPKTVASIESYAFYVGSETGTGLKSLTIETGDQEEYWDLGSEKYVASNPIDNAKKIKSSTGLENTWARIHNPFYTSKLSFIYNADTYDYAVDSGSGDFENEDVVVPATYYNEEKGRSYPVTSIREGAFKNTHIRSITLPSSVEKLGANAFLNCTYLTSINIENVTSIGENCFYNCKKLEKINTDKDTSKINDKVTIIPEGAFYNSGILSVTLPKNCKIIGKSAFDSCFSLSEVTLNNSLEEINTYAFQGTAISEVDIPGTVLKIGNSAFMNCKELETLTLNEGTRVIASSAFAYDSKLTTISLPSTIDTLYSGCFYNSGLTEITASETKFIYYDTSSTDDPIEDSLRDLASTPTNFTNSNTTHFCEYVMDYKNTGLIASLDGTMVINTTQKINAISLYDENTSISGDYNLKIPATYIMLTKSEESPFQVVEITELYSYLGSKIAEPETLKSISLARQYLNSIELSPNIKTINDYALYDCYKLTEISIPSSVKYLMKFAIGHSSIVEEKADAKLNYLVIPSTLTYIEPLGNFRCAVGGPETYTYSNYKNLYGVYVKDIDSSWTSSSLGTSFKFGVDPVANLATLKGNDGAATQIISDNFYDEEQTEIYYNPLYISCNSDERYVYKGDTLTYTIDLSEFIISEASYNKWVVIGFYNGYSDAIADVYISLDDGYSLFTNVVYTANSGTTTSLTTEFNNANNWGGTQYSSSYYLSYSTALVETLKNTIGGYSTETPLGTLTITMQNNHASKDFTHFYFYTGAK